MNRVVEVKSHPAGSVTPTVQPSLGGLRGALASRRWLAGGLLFALDLIFFFLAHRSLLGAYLDDFSGGAFVPLFAVPATVTVCTLLTIGGYDVRNRLRGVAYFSEHILALLLAAVLAALIVYAVTSFGEAIRPSRFVLAGTFAAFIPLSLMHRSLVMPWLEAHRARKTLLVFGAGEAARMFYETYQSKPNSQRLVFVDPLDQRVGERVAGKNSPVIEGGALEKLRGLSREYDGVIVAEGAADMPAELRDALVRIHFEQVPVYTLETFFETHWRMVPVSALNPFWPLQMGFQFTRDYPYLHVKRLFDIVSSGTALVFLSPLLLLVAAAILLGSGRPVIFRQRRIGTGGRPFVALKFRTMLLGSEKGAPTTAEHDPRITRLGRFLRRTRLDELPQLWNVFKGEMSLIGPRAESAECVAEYEALIPSYHLRHLVKPGITGWAQVNYPYGADYADAIEKLRYDLYYIRHHSLRLDAMIVLKTVQVMVSARGR